MDTLGIKHLECAPSRTNVGSNAYICFVELNLPSYTPLSYVTSDIFKQFEAIISPPESTTYLQCDLYACRNVRKVQTLTQRLVACQTGAVMAR